MVEKTWRVRETIELGESMENAGANNDREVTQRPLVLLTLYSGFRRVRQLRATRRFPTGFSRQTGIVRLVWSRRIFSLIRGPGFANRLAIVECRVRTIGVYAKPLSSRV